MVLLNSPDTAVPEIAEPIVVAPNIPRPNLRHATLVARQRLLLPIIPIVTMILILCRIMDESSTRNYIVTSMFIIQSINKSC
jgi:hypothetical protein